MTVLVFPAEHRPVRGGEALRAVADLEDGDRVVAFAPRLTREAYKALEPRCVAVHSSDASF